MQQQLIIVLISKMPRYEYFGMWEFVTQIPPNVEPLANEQPSFHFNVRTLLQHF